MTHGGYMSKSEQKKNRENYNGNRKNGIENMTTDKKEKNKNDNNNKRKKIEHEKKEKVYRVENSNVNSTTKEKSIRSNVKNDISNESIDKKVKNSEAEVVEKNMDIKPEINEQGEKINQKDNEIEQKNSSKVQNTTANIEDKKEESVKKVTREKKDTRPATISISDKSELFKQIIDIALSCEKIEKEKKKLKEKNKVLLDENTELKDERDSLRGNLAATELLCKSKQQEIDNLKKDVAHRDDVIGIVKADKDESAQEFKNALAASLRTFMIDYKELVSMDMSSDVGYALAETLDGVFKLLVRNGINVEK